MAAQEPPPAGFSCPYREACPHLGGLSTAWVQERHNSLLGSEAHYEHVIAQLHDELTEARGQHRADQREIAELRLIHRLSHTEVAAHLRLSEGGAKSNWFKAKENLPFTLLSDPTAEMIARYGSWGEKSFMGRKSLGILRTTVLIDGEGKIGMVFPKVSPKTHATDVLEALDALRSRA